MAGLVSFQVQSASTAKGESVSTDATYMRAIHTIENRDLRGAVRHSLKEILTVSTRVLQSFAAVPPLEATAAQSIHPQRPVSF
jgi:hypothetical protein